jgi:hypothetical protein
LFEADVVEPVHHARADLQEILSAEWLPSLVPFRALHALLCTTSGGVPEQPSSPEATFGVSNGFVLQLAATAEGLQCASEGDRIDTAKRVSLQPDLVDQPQLVAHLESLQRKIYADDYAKVSSWRRGGVDSVS